MNTSPLSVAALRVLRGRQILAGAARDAIFRHELSHGAYFIDPDYASLSRRLWADRLTEEERRSFTAFLGRQEYDVADSDLMINETRAYRIHTADKRFFEPEAAGLSRVRAAALRNAFIPAIDLPWPRDSALTVLPAGPLAEPSTAKPAAHAGKARQGCPARAYARPLIPSADRHGKGHCHHAALAKAGQANPGAHRRIAG